MRLLCIEPQAVTARIAFLKDLANAERDKDFIISATRDVAMVMNIISTTELPAVVLVDRPVLNTLILQNAAVELDAAEVDLDDLIRLLVRTLKAIISAPQCLGTT
jgi:hypothetical protein